MINYSVAEIHLNHLAYNLNQICKKVAPAEVMAVVKANAYGHGAIPVTKRLVKEGVKYFAVARIAEAVELRKAGIQEKILIFGSLFQDEIEKSINYNVSVTVTDESDISVIAGAAKKYQKIAVAHANIDTGMGRVGILPENALQTITAIMDNDFLRLEGVYMHYATSDERDKSYALQQLKKFNSILDQMKGNGIELPIIHASNSGAILDLPEARFDMVRAGISLYGHYPSTNTSESIRLKQVMTLKTKVSSTRRLPKGSSISYGRKYFTDKETSIAVLPIGYADGIHRAFINLGEVLINGQLYPMVGTVTMDQIMVDVGDDPVKVGDDVIFWGDTPQGRLQATKVADKIGTISYELCCGITKRVPRIYID